MSAFSRHACFESCTQRVDGCAIEALFNAEEAFSRRCRKLSRWHQMAATALRNKRRAVAAQTARSRCKVLSIQYVYYFRAYQRQMTLHSVGVINKLYFAILAHFKNELMQWRGVRRPSGCLSVNFCANRFFSQTNGRIATKLAHDGLQVSVHPGCA